MSKQKSRPNKQLPAGKRAQRPPKMGSGKVTTIIPPAAGVITFPSSPPLICSLGSTASALCFPVLHKKISQYLILENYQLLSHLFPICTALLES